MSAILVILGLVVGFPLAMFLLTVLMGSLLVMRLAVDASRCLHKTTIMLGNLLQLIGARP